MITYLLILLDDVITVTITALVPFAMSVLDKFRKGAVKAGIQATAFLKEGSSRVQSSSQSFAQGFSLPGEAEKAAKILASFLGPYIYLNTPRFVLNLSNKLTPTTPSLL